MGIQLSSPRLRVVLGDDRVVQVQAINADLVRFDMVKARHKEWPTAEEGPLLWVTFVAWAALRRTAVIPESVTWDDFWQSAQDVENLTDDSPDGSDAVDPTRLEAVPS
jgi:hypothetical protein